MIYLLHGLGDKIDGAYSGTLNNDGFLLSIQIQRIIMFIAMKTAMNYLCKKC